MHFSSHVLSKAMQLIICCTQLADCMTQLQWYDSGRAFEYAGETGSSALLQLNKTTMKCLATGNSSGQRETTRITHFIGSLIWRINPYMSLCVSTQSCPILFDPVDCSLPGFSVHGILQARILEWIAIPFSRGTSQPRDRTLVSCLAGRFFTVWTTGKSINESRFPKTMKYY